MCEKVVGYNADFIDKRVCNSEDIAKFCIDILKTDRYTKEHFMVFMLDVKLRIIGFSDVAIGSLDAAPVHPRDVFQPAVATPKCAAIVVCHNHPSGSSQASSEDLIVTNRLQSASEIIGIKLIDHIIVGDNEYTSLKTEGFF